MKTIFVAGSKGGVGKSLSCCQISGLLNQQGRSTLILNTDDQSQTARNWCGAREQAKGFQTVRYTEAAKEREIHNLLQRAAEMFEYVVVDSHHHLSNVHRYLAENADLTICPTQPGSIIEQDKILNLLNEYEANYRVLLTQVKANTNEHRNQIAQMDALGTPRFKTMLSDRIGFQEVRTNGLLISETKHTDASAEMRLLFEEVLQEITNG